MHSLDSCTANVPAFLTKLWRLVEDPQTDSLIGWTQNGQSFVIHNQAMFARELLPQYYKHNNMASFVRQLNMYGFHKVVSADSGGLRIERDDMEFAHPHFIRDQKSLLENIKRKQQRRLPGESADFLQMPSGRVVTTSEENKVVTKLLTDVQEMKRDQETVSSKFLALKRENEALWREYASMRQKFSKQQQIIEKLIHFLVAMVKSPSKTLPQKRKVGHHLALESGEGPSTANPKIISSNSPVELMGGAIIHEVTDLVDLDSTSSGADLFNVGEESLIINTSNKPIKVEHERPVVQMTSEEDELYTTFSPEADPIPIVTSPATSIDLGHCSPQPKESFSCLLTEDDPLSPELLETVDPSEVTPSIVTTRMLASSFKTVVSESSTPLTSTVNTSSNKKQNTQIVVGVPDGKIRNAKKIQVSSASTSQATSPKTSKAVAVPEKPEIQNHVDDMQHSLDSLQELLTSNAFNLDSSTLLSLFSNADNLSELGNFEGMQDNSEVMEKWEVSQLLFADDTALVAGSEEGLRKLVAEFGRVCDRRKLKINVGKWNEVSLYTPSFQDLVGSMEDDPLSLTTSSSTAVIGNMLPPKTGPTPPKQLRLNVKKEVEDLEEEESLLTPQVVLEDSPSYFICSKGKNRGST
ncbi:heat shock factor isoform X2 [Oratosquilla oratoria]|uniref:heat shock factor isoform X2 n=1 Tax=Oratosquilla oratoria TaxID=337810 RepID=UPI003F7605A5